jgi:hypothetical protein
MESFCQVQNNFYFFPFKVTASATSVKAISVLRQCYNFLNVSYSAHCKKCFTCVRSNQKEHRILDKCKNTGAYLPNILETNQASLQTQNMETKNISWTV